MNNSNDNSTSRTRGILFILSGPSGVGKDTVLRRAIPKIGHLRLSISVTTRAPRRGEVDGRDYFFVSHEAFAEMMERGEFLEHAAVHGHFYGTPRLWVQEQLQRGTDIVLEIDVQGAVQVKSVFPQAILVFLAPPNWPELARRLRSRNTEDEATIRRRLENARAEIARTDQYDYLIVNDQLAEATDRLCAVITAERLRPWRQDVTTLLSEGDIDG